MPIRTKWGNGSNPQDKKWGTFKWGGSGVLIGTTSYTETYDTNIEDQLTAQSNTATFGVINTTANRPVSGSNVELWFKGVLVFAGRLANVVPHKIQSDLSTRANSQFMFECYCEDYTFDLKKHLVAQTYTSSSLHTIVADILSTYVDALDGIIIDAAQLSAGSPGPTIDKMVFNYITPAEAFTKLCELIGWDWYIDYQKKLHFFSLTTGVANAPFDLDDDGTAFLDLEISPDDITQIRNRIFVQGGSYLSTVYTQTVKPTAKENSINLNYEPFTAAGAENIISIAVNTVAKTFGIDNIDDAGGHDFLVNSQSKTVKCDTFNSGAFAGTESVVITYCYKIPLISRIDGTESIARLKALGCGNGIFEATVNEEEINTLEWAEVRGLQELTQYANPLITGSFKTLTAGFRTGQRIKIALTDRGYTTPEYLLIRRVNMDAIGNNQLESTVEFATKLFGLDQLILDIVAMQDRKQSGENDIVNQLYVITEEISVSDTVTSSVKQPPFKWSNDDGTTPNKAVWNESTWS